MSQLPDEEDISFLGFSIWNGSLVIFYLGFWILGWRISAWGNLFDDYSGRFFVLWFASFFTASLISLRRFLKRPVFPFLISFVAALVFSLLLYILICISHLLLAPFLDPMF